MGRNPCQISTATKEAVTCRHDKTATSPCGLTLPQLGQDELSAIREASRLSKSRKVKKAVACLGRRAAAGSDPSPKDRRTAGG